ncbi:MAG: ATP-binding protein [Okeania sp. SIO2H7]|nr:ATP-binding protein [Okeania sp. SIO2H7]
MWGGNGVGKTSFLEYLASPEVWQLRGYDLSEAIIVYLNCLSINPFSTESFWREILTLIQEQLEDEVSCYSELDKLLAKAEVTLRDMRKILRKIGKQNKFLVLLLDDYDTALKPHSKYTADDIETFLNECRNLAYHWQEKQYLSMVVSSSRRLTEVGPSLTPDGSPWYNHYFFQPLKPLTNNEVATLLSGMPMTPELRDGILEIAGGHPALLQNAGFILYGQRRSGVMPDAEKFARDFLTTTEQYFQGTWQLANELEQTLLMLIALFNLKGRLQKNRYDLGDISIIFSQRERELKDLEERGIITINFAEERPNYAFASSLMEWWVIKEIENSDDAALQQRQKVFLNLMSHKQLEEVTKTIETLWEHKDDIQSLVQWAGKLAGAFPKGFIGG